MIKIMNKTEKREIHNPKIMFFIIKALGCSEGACASWARWLYHTP